MNTTPAWTSPIAHTAAAAAPDTAAHTALAHALAAVPAGAELDRATYERTPSGYERAVVHQTADLELVALRWPRSVSSPLHGHGRSAVVLRVLSGRVLEEQFIRIAPPSSSAVAAGAGPSPRFLARRAVLEPGGMSYLPPGSFHRVLGLEDAVAIHAYSPRLVDPTEPPDEATVRELADAWRRALPPAQRASALPAWLQNAECRPEENRR